MISWMQKNNKYLIVTIWIATIAFIGAGFVGWGSYQYGSKADAIGRVGDIDITQEKFDMTYQNLYSQYNEIFKGQFDEARAKQMGLASMAFNSLASQAQLLNLAKKYGVVVSEKELAEYITTIKGFQDNGVFNRSIYEQYLKSRGLRAKTFESILKDELIVQKLMGLIETEALPYEVNILASSLSISDRIAYKVIKPTDIEVKIDDEELKNYWQMFKNRYMTPKAYSLDILWTDTSSITVDDKEIREFYDKNSYNYVDSSGKVADFEKVRTKVETDLKLKKAKKQALKEYVSFKKGEIKASETKELTQNSTDLSSELWQEINKAKQGDIIKPKVVGDKYATVKILKTIEPKEMSFEQAKGQVQREFVTNKRKEMLTKKSEEILKNIDNEKLTETGWMTMSKFDNMEPLSKQETLQFLQKLFTSSAKNGIISVSNSAVVYKIVEQKIDKADDNLSKIAENSANSIKKAVFESNLFKTLNKAYPAQKFVKGI